MQQSQLVKKIAITPKEQEIFNTILNFRNQTQLTSILRVAGGWVRDKLMGKESHDIDIAIDNMTGEQFVLKMKEYLESQHIKVSGFGVTRLNPQQSKHLETACIKISNESIDFVNLRGETYSDDSRTPQIIIGTPEQDAFRRDLTINSLFYNLNTEQIEDFTKMGLQDLDNGIIRTPLDPFITFKDDPLRILRTFRFATRFNFQIVEQIPEAIKKQEIKDALKVKVSRERIGIEIDWMLKNFKCLQGLKNYFDLGLWNIIFSLPTNAQQCSIKEEDQGKYHIQSFSYLLALHNQLKLQGIKIYGLDDEELQMKYLNLAAICLPYFKITYKKGKLIENAIEYIISESLKFTKKTTDDIVQTCRLVETFSALKQEDLKQNYKKVVEYLQDAKYLWHLILYIEHLQQLIQNPQASFEQSENFKQFIFSQKLEDFYLAKPLIDGNETKQIWNVEGKFIKDIKQNILIWQAMNRQGTKQDLLAYIEQNKEKFLDK